MTAAHYNYIEYIGEIHIETVFKRTRIIQQRIQNPKRIVSRETVRAIFRCRSG